MPKGLIALAIASFGIGLTEFVIMGLLPNIATEFAVTEAVAGWLISGYALAVVVGALVVTAAVTRLPRKAVLIGLMGLFIAGNLLSALAPSYAVLMGGRVLAALCHGAFFGIGSVFAANMVPAHRKAGAIALMFTGLTAANVLGVPFGTLLGQQFGWRATFWAITLIGVIATAGIAVLAPRDDMQAESAPSLRREMRAFTRLQVWLSIAVTILGFGGVFGAFTYIAFTLTEVSGFASSTVPWLLVLFGVGGFIGNVVGGKAADRSVDRALIVFIAALAVSLVGFALTAHSRPATIVALLAMGAAAFGSVPALQMRVMTFGDEAPTMASAANIGAFNLGNALGAWIGGLTLTAGFGYTSPIWAGAALTASALLVLCVAITSGSRTKNNGLTASPGIPRPVS
ncbi:MFS transporter [Rhodococcus sp. 1R11]|uniref:MFS transporter n=1 Tax=Rhodococcus ruber TaxID=1830 RepID=A0ABT4MD04_9NOCA|nr:MULTISPECIES: MFS transporter [Rhodococcus]MCZ4518864.1 MFS transporter [Rhodococcus ruber]MDI9933706.1 MFS transporter [Rhodococcus sp. IEGM 1354]TFI42403.1 MFS transporter [Rhodococcus sp. 1R11]